MKKNNLKIVKIDKIKKLFNYEKKVLIKELVLDLKLGYFDFEKERDQKVKFNLEVNYEDKKPSLSFLPRCLLICGHFSLFPININGKDLSSLNKILNFGLCFLIKFASKSNASLSLDVVVISNFLVWDNILSVLIIWFFSDT